MAATVSLLDLPVELIMLIARSLEPLTMKDFYHLLRTHRCLFNILLPHFNRLAATAHTTSAFFWAAAVGNEPMIRLLEAEGVVSIRGQTCGPAQSDNLVKIALSRGANITITPRTTGAVEMPAESALRHAVRGKLPALTHLLLERGASVTEKAHGGEYILHTVAMYGAKEATVREMIRLGADVNAIDTYGRTPLHRVVTRRSWSYTLTKILLEHGADTMIQGTLAGENVLQARLRRYGGTLLPICSLGDEYDDDGEDDARFRRDIRLLLKHGSVAFRDRVGRSGLHMAAASGDVSLARTLVARAINVNARDSTGATALHLAIEYDFASVARVLLAGGANTALGDNYGDTPLHLATRLNRPGMIRLLLWSGVDTSVSDNFCSTALHLAAEWEDAAVLRLLLNAGADVHVRDKALRTPLLLAARHGHVDAVRALADRGANVLDRDRHDRGIPRWVMKEM